MFGRLVASDQAIEDAAVESEISALYLTPEAMGYSPEEFALYRKGLQDARDGALEDLDRQVAQDEARTTKAAWRQARARIQPAVKQDVASRPVYQALAAIRRGQKPDGTPLVEGQTVSPMKLDRATLLDAIGPERLALLPAGVVTEDGTNPADVAEMFGYGSVDELATALTAAPPMWKVIRDETAQQLLHENPSILTDGSMPERAKAAWANDAALAVLRAELAALARQQRQARPFVAQALAGAEAERAYERRWFEAEEKLKIAIAEGRKQVEIDALRKEVQQLKAQARGGAARIRAAIPSQDVMNEQADIMLRDRTKVRELDPRLYWRAARRASRLATEAAAKQRFDDAIAAKQLELFNVTLFSKATQLRELIAKRAEMARGLGDEKSQARIAKASPTLWQQIAGVLDRLSFAKMPQKVLDARSDIRDWVAAMQGQDVPLDLPDEILNDLRRTPYQELLISEFIGVTDGLMQLRHTARTIGKSVGEKIRYDRSVKAHGLAVSIKSFAKRTIPQSKGDLKGLGHEWRSKMVIQRQLMSMARQMDGGVNDGPMTKAFTLRINKSSDHEQARHARYAREFERLVMHVLTPTERINLEKPQTIANGPVNAKTGRPETFTGAERIVVALNWGNEGNRQRLRDGYHWRPDQIEAVIATLSPTEVQFVRGVFDMVESLWPDAAAKETRVYGVAPERVEAAGFMTPQGWVKGGYFPIKFNDEKAWAISEAETAQQMMHGAFASASTKRGAMKARQESVKDRPLRLAFSTIYTHVAEMIHDVSFHETLIDLNALLREPELREAIVDHYGREWYSEMKAAMLSVAGGDMAAMDAGNRSLEWVRSGTSFARMGWNAMTTILQPIGVTMGATYLGEGNVAKGTYWMTRGVASFLGSAVKMENAVKEIHAKSVFMENRARTMTREIHEVRNKISPRGSWALSTLGSKVAGRAGARAGYEVASKYGAIEDTYFLMIGKGQMVADVTTWLGGYHKALHDGHVEEEAVALADQAVRGSQGSGLNADLARVMRGAPSMRVWTQFMTYFSIVFNQNAEALGRTKWTSPAAVVKLGADLLMINTVPMLLEEGLRGLFASDDQDKRKKKHGWLFNLLSNQAQYVMNTVPFVRELSGTLQGFGYSGPAGGGVFKEGSTLLALVLKEIDQWDSTTLTPEQIAKRHEDELKSVNQVAGILFHYPATEVERMARAAAALDHSAWDAFKALFGYKPAATR